jgi:putative hydrolase of the HAD superfamily
VIFDLGHTLIDFAPAEDNLLECYERVRRMLVHEASQDLPRAEDLIDSVSRRVAQDVIDSYQERRLEEVDIVALFRDALGDIGVDVDEKLARQIAEMEHRAMLSGLTIEPDNVETLGRVRKAGLLVGLVSNAHFLPELMREDIARLGIAGRLDASVFSAEVGVRKPHPDIFFRVLGELNVSPAEAIFVGDRLVDDIEGAQKVGMRGVLTHQFRQEDLSNHPIVPDLVIQRLSEVIPYATG